MNITKASIRNHEEASPTTQMKIAGGYKTVFFKRQPSPSSDEHSNASTFILLVSQRSVFKFRLHRDLFVLTAIAVTSACLFHFHLFPTQAKLLLMSTGGASSQTLCRLSMHLSIIKRFNNFTFGNYISNKIKAKML